MARPLVYVLILNWNSYGYAVRCIESLQVLDYPNYRIVIIDNASVDSSEQILRAHFPELPFIQTGANLGYAGGNNRGIAYALTQGAEYIWLLNVDTYVDRRALSTLVEAMEANVRVGLAGSKIYYMEPPERICYAGGCVNFWLGITFHRGDSETDTGQYDQPAQVDFVTGSSLMVRSSVIKQVGPLIESYFLYFEDVEWSLRIHKAGFELLFVPDSVVWHKEGGTSGGRTNPDVIYYGIRNNLYLIERHFPVPQRLMAGLRLVLSNVRFLLRNTANTQYRSAVLQAGWDYIRRVTGQRTKPSTDV
ncbi:MAG: glycosyltransferase family 2 protein [Gemmatimonadaceae bacterium]|nr:glycosyltransferase family 2 protein [Gloeobacterales cyanobacterium ES-bin-141]